jgi:hypothetical protein
MNPGTRAPLAALACAALVGVPALARAQQGPPDFFVARDLPAPPAGPGGHWDAKGDASASSLAIATGGTVGFSYPAGGTSHHTVVFTSDRTPACTGLPAPGNPFLNGRPGWSGSCRFDRAGTYTFVCELHPDMTGTVTVSDPATPTPTASPGATPTATPGGAYATPTPTPVQSTLRPAVKLASRQTGTRVRGSVQVKAARSRLEVALAARLPGRRKAVGVGHWRKPAAGPGRVAFTVPLSRRARAALRKRHKLALSVAVALTPPGGHKLTRTLHTTLRPG